jgi:PAS domain S-box-containing protein
VARNRRDWTPRQEHMTSTDQRLSRQSIVEAALALVDEHGAASLTMRKLAAALTTAPMSLYTYFPAKEDLLDAVVQAVLAQIEVPPDDDLGWQQRLTAILRSFRSVVRRHPNVGVLIPRYPPREAAALRVVEAGLDTLRRAGFAPDTAAHAYRLVASYAIGHALLDLAGFFQAAGSALETTDSLLGELALYFPRLAEAGPHLSQYNPDEEFEIGLAYILTGLSAELDQSELTTAQAHLAAIVQSSDDAILSKTPQGVITSWNPAAERLYGYTAGEVMGRSVSVIIPRHRATEQQGILHRIAQGQRVDHHKTERVRKDGTLVWVSLTVSPIKNPAGAIIGASAIARPIDPPTGARPPAGSRARRPAPRPARKAK